MRSPDEPLHAVDPFDSFDLRVMMPVGENRAWAAAVAQRCSVIAREIEKGILPCDRPGPYIDEVLFGAAMHTARAWAMDDSTLMEPVPPREESGLNVGDDVDMVEDDYWDELSGAFDDRARWLDYSYPLWSENAGLRLLLDARPPLTWLDPQVDADPELVAQMNKMFGVKE